MRRLFVFSLVAAACGAACSKDAPQARGEAPGGAGVRLGKLGLEVQLSNGAEVGDNPLDEGSVMVTGGEVGAFTVSRVDPNNVALPKTFEEARQTMDMYSPKKVSRSEKTADGWHIAFENEGGLGRNYFVWIRRSFGGQSFACETMLGSADQAAAVTKACLSLKKG